MSVVLCVEAKALLPTSPWVRKDAYVKKILTWNIKDFSDKESAAKEGYVPVDFAISTRSIYDNTVLAYQQKDGGVQYYLGMTDINLIDTNMVIPYRGFDLLMFLASLAFLESVEYTKDVDVIMLHHSQFQPIGLYYPDEAFVPVFYSHLLISDEGMKLLEPHLKPGVTITPIQTMTREGNPSAFLETLIIVKEEHHE